MIRAVVRRALLVALLLGAYVYGWRPYGRPASVHALAAPLLRSVVAGAPRPWEVRPRPGGHRLTLAAGDGAPSIGWTAPAGVRFLLPALGVALLAPRRPYWLVLWGGHLLLGGLGLLFLCLGVTTGAFWFLLYDGLTQYLVDAFSLGVAAWAVIVDTDLASPLTSTAPPADTGS